MPARPWATEADYTAGSSSLDGKTSPGLVVGLCWDCWDCWDCGSSSLGDGKTTTGLVFGLCVCTKSPPHDEELLVNGLADRKHNAHVVKRCR